MDFADIVAAAAAAPAAVEDVAAADVAHGVVVLGVVGVESVGYPACPRYPVAFLSLSRDRLPRSTSRASL